MLWDINEGVLHLKQKPAVALKWSLYREWCQIVTGMPYFLLSSGSYCHEC